MTLLPAWTKAVLMLAVVALLAGGSWLYRAEQQQARVNVEERLIIIARLKVFQILTWRAEHLGHAAVLMDSPFLLAAIGGWLEDPRPGAVREAIRVRFTDLCEHYGYDDALLLDPDRQVRLSLSGRGEIHPEEFAALDDVERTHKPVLVDLHASAMDGTPHLKVVVPLFAGAAAEAQRPIGAAIFVCDPRQFLYPLIQSWPTPSRSAETLLVRRDVDDVLFLNELRHRLATALKLRIPVSRRDLPASMAVLGKEGVVQGRDYRGVQVVAFVTAIPDSPWFMVAKVDAAEIFAPWRRRSALIVGGLLGLAALVGAAGLIVWQRNQSAHYRVLYQSEAALHASQERYGITLRSIADGVIATDPHARVELLNPVAEALTGWSQTEALGKPVTEIFRIAHEETRRPVADPVSRVIREGVSVMMANHTVLIARDGTERAIADSAAPIRNDDGQLVGVVQVFHDQTEQRAARKAVDHLAAIVEFSDDAIISTTLDGTIVSWNRAGEKIYGYARQDAIGNNFAMLVPEARRPELHEILETIARGERIEHVDTVCARRDGKSLSVALTVSPMRDATGAVNGASVIARDITARKLAEELLHKLNEDLASSNRELEHFAYVASHDLQEPLRMVSSYTQLLAKRYEDKLDEDAREFIHYAVDGADRMQHLIHDLLSYSRVATHGDHFAPVDTAAVLGEATANLQMAIQESGAVVTHGPLPVLNGDRSQLMRVFQNLIANAIKFRKGDEPPSVHVSCEPRDGHWCFAVQDNGIGIDRQYFERIFVIFQRLHTREEYPGTGLGLALCQRIVVRHGGEMWVESEVGQGTTFFFTIPSAAVLDAATHEPRAPA
jgi:PAS domain S-box-containing protein